MVIDDGVARALAVGDFIAARRRLTDSSPTLEWLGSLLHTEGVDLLQADGIELARGTPVYVRSDADVLLVQRLMARNHIRAVAVLDDGRLVGIVDLLDLATQDLSAAG